MVLNQPSELYEVIAKSLALKLLAQTTEPGATGVGATSANAQRVGCATHENELKAKTKPRTESNAFFI